MCVDVLRRVFAVIGNYPRLLHTRQRSSDRAVYHPGQDKFLAEGGDQAAVCFILRSGRSSIQGGFRGMKHREVSPIAGSFFVIMVQQETTACERLVRLSPFAFRRSVLPANSKSKPFAPDRGDEPGIGEEFRVFPLVLPKRHRLDVDARFQEHVIGNSG